MSGTHAISTTSRREMSSSFFPLQGKAPKEIHAILTETLAFSFLVGLRTYQHPSKSTERNKGTLLAQKTFTDYDSPCLIRTQSSNISLCFRKLVSPSATLSFNWTVTFFIPRNNTPPPPHPSGPRPPHYQVSRSHTPHNLQDSSGRVIGPSQRPLPFNTQH